MARYFMHLVDGDDVLLDPEGVEATSEEAQATALDCARDCMAGDVKAGTLNLSYRIDVHDAADAIVHSVSFRDAVEIKGL